jgi:PAS fold.
MEFVSQGCLELTGYLPDELIDNKEKSYAELIHPEDRENIFKTISTSVQQRKPFQLLYRIRCKDGTEKWVWEKGNALISKKEKLKLLKVL